MYHVHVSSFIVGDRFWINYMYMYVLPLILVESGLATKNVYSYNKMYLLSLQEIDSGLAKKYMYLPSLQRDSCITKNT
jgi:hypothetical protein